MLSSNKKKFGKKAISEIEKLFGVKPQISGNSVTFNIRDTKKRSDISLEIISGDKDECLISVYTNNCHLQLQSCTGFLISDMLEEVIFISETEKLISGLLISKQCDCSLYSSVDKSLLKKDFSELDSEKLMSAVALSVAENIQD